MKEKWNEDIEICDGCGIKWKKKNVPCKVCGYNHSSKESPTNYKKLCKDSADKGRLETNSDILNIIREHCESHPDLTFMQILTDLNLETFLVFADNSQETLAKLMEQLRWKDE